jgi:hypothetical protein
VQNGADGYRVTVERVIRGGDADRTEKIVTTYEPKPKIVEYGTRKRPPPPSPSPSPSESSPKPKDPKPKEPDPTPTSSG